MGCLCGDHAFAIDEGGATSVEPTRNDKGPKLELGSGMSLRIERSCNEKIFEPRLFVVDVF